MKGTIQSWGSTRVILALALLGYAWRLQDLFPVVGHFKPVTLVTGAFFLTLLVDRKLPDYFVAVAARRPALYAVGLSALAFLGIPTSLYPGMSLNVALRELMPSVVLLIGIAATTRRPVDAYRLAGVEVFGALVFSLVVLTRYSVGIGGRLGDLIYYDANGLGLILVCTLPMAEWYALHSSYIASRVAAVGTIGILLSTIVKTGSRGAFLGLVAVVAYGIFANRSAPIRRRLTLGILASVMLLGTAGTQYWTNMTTILHPTQDYNWVGNDDEGRMSVWTRGIGYMLGHPLTGVGAGAFPVAEGTISPLASRQDYDVGLKWSAAHNSFVQVGAELGIPGLILFIALLVTALGRARQAVEMARGIGDERAASMADALAASIVGFMVSGFFLSEGYGAYIYSVLGIVIGLHSALLRRTTAEERRDLAAVPPQRLTPAEFPAWGVGTRGT